MTRLRRLERTDGRRKGYQAYRGTVADRLDAETLAKLERLRGPERKPANSNPHG